MSNRDPEALIEDIEATRRRIRGTLDSLTTRLSPAQMLSRGIYLGQCGIRESYGHLRLIVRNYPLSLVVTVAGVISLLIVSRRAARSAFLG
jgi:hypothetical protein